MAVPITALNFVVLWDEDESEWKGMVEIPPREDVLVTEGDNAAQVLIDILCLARYVLILQDGSAGIMNGSGLIAACETLQRNCREAETFLAQQEDPHDTVNCMWGVIDRMLLCKGPTPWHVLPPKGDTLSYVVTTMEAYADGSTVQFWKTSALGDTYETT